jgi:hypothetical protein
MWATWPRSVSSGNRKEFHEDCYQKHTNPLNSRNSSSDISGYHADFHEAHGLFGEWQGRGMEFVNCELTRHIMAGIWHGRGMACVK